MRKHHTLFVWQQSKNLVTEIYQLTNYFPKDETYGLIQQIKRAAISIPANISEGIGRNTYRDTIQFLYISRGSLFELETLLCIAIDLTFLKKEDGDKILIEL